MSKFRIIPKKASGIFVESLVRIMPCYYVWYRTGFERPLYVGWTDRDLAVVLNHHNIIDRPKKRYISATDRIEAYYVHSIDEAKAGAESVLRNDRPIHNVPEAINRGIITNRLSLEAYHDGDEELIKRDEGRLQSIPKTSTLTPGQRRFNESIEKWRLKGLRRK